MKQCFAALHGTDELLVSFDAICAHRPWWHPGGDRNWRCKSGFFHADQTAVSRGRFIEPLAIPDSEPDYIQGAVNLLPMSEHTGGHCLVPNSHIHFTELMAKHNIHSNGFPIPPTEPVLAKSIIPHMEAGDMLLFGALVVPLLCYRQFCRCSRASYSCSVSHGRDVKCILFCYLICNGHYVCSKRDPLFLQILGLFRPVHLDSVQDRRLQLPQSFCTLRCT
eukprot:SAG31_NODE_263_length_18841_cov_17.270996_3_plen_221_part_00